MPTSAHEKQLHLPVDRQGDGKGGEGGGKEGGRDVIFISFQLPEVN